MVLTASHHGLILVGCQMAVVLLTCHLLQDSLVLLMFVRVHLVVMSSFVRLGSVKPIWQDILGRCHLLVSAKLVRLWNELEVATWAYASLLVIWNEARMGFTWTN